MKTNNLLIEIGTEELPAKALPKIINAFKAEMIKELDNANLAYKDIEHFATPRRLALRVLELAERQPDSQQERKGPAIKAAFDDNGEPTKACLGFARSVNADAKDLREKDGYLYFTLDCPGKTVSELLPDILNLVINRLPVPKRMRWGDYDVEFSRPVHWAILLYGAEVIPATILSLKTSNKTYGHRFHHPAAIQLQHADDYEQALHQAKVIAGFEKRRETIHQQIIQIAKQANGIAIVDPDLLDEVTGLVEWPHAIKADFSPRFLDVPAESLISAMEQHQKSFALLDDKQSLLPAFITISNIESKKPENVKQGNEKVMHARLSDAEFFYQNDLKKPLTQNTNNLKTVIFQKELGSLFDKTTRIKTLMQQLTKSLDVDASLAERAALLSKADLLSDMVGEFPELQGTMGYYYAKHAGEPLDVATALKEQYLPRFANDNLPKTTLGSLLAIADRIDTIVGIFGINRAPTGEKDPFGLRRAALGILRIIIDNQLDIDLAELIDLSIDTYQEKITNPKTKIQVLDFILERLRRFFGEQNISADIFNAVFARKPTSPLDFANRVKAIQAFKTLDDADALAAANKRVSRILQKEEISNQQQPVNPALLKEQAEIQLSHLLQEKQAVVAPLFMAHDYQKALTELAELRPAIDLFFDQVLVMDKDNDIKNNRLNLLYQLRQLFLEVADISLLQ